MEQEIMKKKKKIPTKIWSKRGFKKTFRKTSKLNFFKRMYPR